MTKRQKELVYNLRLKLLRSGYPKIFAVDMETLEATEVYLEEWLKERGASPILKCGKFGLFFKGCELVLKVEVE